MMIMIPDMMISDDEPPWFLFTIPPDARPGVEDCCRDYRRQQSTPSLNKQVQYQSVS